MKILDTLQQKKSELVSGDNPFDTKRQKHEFVPIQLIDLVTPYNDQSTLVCLMDQMCTERRISTTWRYLEPQARTALPKAPSPFFFGRRHVFHMFSGCF